jgi:hypothetical protein
MGLIFDVLSAIGNPSQAASVDGLSAVTTEIQQVAERYGLDASATQGVLSSAGGQLRSALQQQASGDRPVDLGGLLAQVAGGNATVGALSSLVPPQVQAQLLQGLAQKYGFNASSAQGLLPSLLPLLLKFLNLGAPSTGSGFKNPVLASFLDCDRDGDVDFGDAFKFANRFLTAPR